MLPAGSCRNGGTMLKHCLLWFALSATGAAQTLQLDSGLVTDAIDVVDDGGTLWPGEACADLDR